MARTRLILCDGLPGSGKTTTTQQLWMHLDGLGRRARWWFEHQLHHPVLGYAKARDALLAGPDAVRSAMAAAHEGWAGLAARGESPEDTVLLESTLFQTTLGTQLLADWSRTEILAHFERTAALLAPVEPQLIHLRAPDVARALRTTCDRRGPWFLDFLQTELAATPRGRRVGRADFAALLDYFNERHELSDELCRRFPGPVLVHDNSDADWERQRRAITDWLRLPPMQPASPPAQPEQYTGLFRATTGDEWCVVAEPDGLRLGGANPARLLPYGPDRFFIEALCVELRFRRRDDGVVRAIECTAELPDLPVTWVKT
jgi:hypothetical protein